jgi:ribosomal protein L37AE/L43A
MAEKRMDPRAPADIFRAEAEAEAERARLCDESRHQLVNRCPECGSLGSMELVDSVMRCVDCDEVVAAKAQLPGFGRR